MTISQIEVFRTLLAELRRLRELGLGLLYMGPESGDDVTLKRIAKGSGTSVQAVNQLLKQFVQTQKMMKGMKKGLFGRAMKGMKMPQMPF